MKTLTTMAAAAALAASMAAGAQADSLKVGMMLTLSGPPAPLGEHARDGFNLAVKQLGGQLGGVDTEIVIVDDELQPDVAVQRVQALIERDGIDIFVGVIFSNVMMAVYQPLREAEVIMVSPNAGPSPIAGELCSPYFFSTAWQNDQNHEVMGRYAEEQGFERVILLAPNYQAGRDSLAGFKRHFSGEVVDEIYTQLGQLDFSAELARIAAAQPDAFFTFMPGGMGVNLVRQYRQAGLDNIPFLSAFTVDETTLPATQDAALGFLSGAQWAPNLDNDANRAFVEAFEAEYGYAPALYAAQGFDAALLIDSAISAVGGDFADKDAVMEAMRAADFESVRGDFSFNTNQFPIQDFYTVEAVQRDDGTYVTSVIDKVFDDYGDAYAEQCPM
jgi:branched-chain amino acid transport system substrate-binding protein